VSEWKELLGRLSSDFCPLSSDRVSVSVKQ